MTNTEAHLEINEMIHALTKKQEEKASPKRERQIKALLEGCKAIRERDQLNLFG